MTAHRSLVRRSAAAVAAGAAALLLAACGSSGSGSSSGHEGHQGHQGQTTKSPTTSASASASTSASASASKGQNAADVAFAKGMIPHHRQAVEMADLAPTRAESAEVKKLAEEIKKAQDPEIRTLSGWLISWGEEVPAAGGMDHSSHGMGDMGGSGGMMTAEEMDKLKQSSGKAFDTAFAEMMIKHHEGAVAMAKTEKADGSFPDAKTMADAIITSQTAEIARMNTLLGKS